VLFEIGSAKTEIMLEAEIVKIDKYGRLKNKEFSVFLNQIIETAIMYYSSIIVKVVFFFGL
jgi:hypothetical protein